MHICIITATWLFILLLPLFNLRESPVVSTELGMLIYIAIWLPLVAYIWRVGWYTRKAVQSIWMCERRRKLIGDFVIVYLAFGATWFALVVLSLIRYLARAHY